MRHQDVDVRVPRRSHRPRPEDRAVRHQRHAHAHVVGLDQLVIQLEPVRGDGVHQVRVLQRRRRRAQPRRLVVAGGDEVGDTGPGGDAGRLLQEADDDVRRGPHGVEGVAGVDHQVHVPLQDGVHRPPVSLLNVHLPLVPPRLRAQPRVPGVSQVRIRDVRDPYDLDPSLKPAPS